MLAAFFRKSGFVLVTSLLMAASASSQITNGLSLWSTFDDGTAADASPNGNNGIVTGATLVNGVASGALRLDGIDDFIRYVNSASLNPTNQMTICCWFRPVPFVGNGFNSIVGKSYTSHSDPFYQYQLGITGTQYGNDSGRAGFAGTVANQFTTADTPQNYYFPYQWMHVLGIFDGTLWCIFVNSSVIAITNRAGTINSFATDLYVGRFQNLSSPNSFTPGTIDELRIYNRALSSSEIDTLYLYPKGKKERVSGFVTLNNYEPQPAGTTCHFDLIQGGNVVESHDVTLGGNGAYTFATNLTGNYRISCKASHWLSQISDVVNITPDGIDVNFTQINGDVDGDNEVSLVDFGILSAKFGLSIEDENYLESADLNGDLETNLIDYSILAASFGLAGE